MSDEEPLEHIYRYLPPWRRERKTECGRSENDVRRVIERDELRRKIKQLGRQRMAFTTCMTCLDRLPVSKPWEENPVEIVAREGRSELMARELAVLSMLFEAHREEFYAALDGLSEVEQLSVRRRRSHPSSGLRPL